MPYIIIAGDYRCSITAGGFFSLSEREKKLGDRVVLLSYNNDTVVAYSGPAYINKDLSQPVTKDMIDKLIDSHGSFPNIEMSARTFLKQFSDEEHAHIVIGEKILQNRIGDLDDSMEKIHNAVLIAISGQNPMTIHFSGDFPVCFAISDESDELKEFYDLSSTYQNCKPMSQYIDSVQWGLHKNVGDDYGNRLTDIVRLVHGHPASVLRIKGQSTENDLVIGGDPQ